MAAFFSLASSKISLKSGDIGELGISQRTAATARTRSKNLAGNRSNTWLERAAALPVPVVPTLSRQANIYPSETAQQRIYSISGTSRYTKLAKVVGGIAYSRCFQQIKEIPDDIIRSPLSPSLSHPPYLLSLFLTDLPPTHTNRCVCSL